MDDALVVGDFQRVGDGDAQSKTPGQRRRFRPSTWSLAQQTTAVPLTDTISMPLFWPSTS